MNKKERYGTEKQCGNYAVPTQTETLILCLLTARIAMHKEDTAIMSMTLMRDLTNGLSTKTTYGKK